MSSKQSKRRNMARIRAAAKAHELICFSSETVDWIEGAESAEPDKPKRFTMNAYGGGPLQVGYYDAPVVVDLAGLTAKAPLPILMNHSPERIVGHADEIEIAASQLRLTGVVSGGSPEAAQVIASSSAGFPWKASIGARPDKLEFIAANASAQANGKTFKGPVYVARKATLGEVSFVAMAADAKTSVKVAAAAHSRKANAMDELNEWITAIGFDPDALTEQQATFLKATFDAKQKEAIKANPGEPPKVAAPVFDLQANVLTYEKHIAAVQAKAAGYAEKIEATKLQGIVNAAMKAAAELKAEALTNEHPTPWLEVALVKAGSETDAALVRAERPEAPAIHGSNRQDEDAVIQAAFCRSANLPNMEAHFAAPILEAANKMRGFSIGELLLHYAVKAGYTGRMRITDGNLREVLRAAFSVHTVTTLLSSTGNKILLEGFNSIPQSWREVAQVRSVNDFKQVTAYRLTTGLEYQKVGPGGEIQHGTMGQESYTMQADTYARMLALTRQDMINDDLGAFNDLRTRFGIGAAIALNKVFWTAWLAAYSGAAFWTAARGNLVTSSALAEAGLNTAVKAFRDLAAPDGNMMNLEPDLILIPSALEATGRKLYVSQEMRDTTASTKTMTSNIYFNRFRPVVVPELGNSAYTGYSATTWYLLTNPAVLASAIVCFLNGQQNPTIESADADFDTLGVQLRGYHDFGVSMSEYRASVACEA